MDQQFKVSFTNLLDTDLIVLSYFEPSYLAYIKTTNRYIYSAITQYFSIKQELPITKELICANNFVKHNFNNIAIKETRLLDKCIKYGFDIEGIKWLLSKGCKPTMKSFPYAALNGNLDTMKWMLQGGFPKNKKNTFNKAAKNGNLDNMKWLLQKKFTKSAEAIVYAAKNNKQNFSSSTSLTQVPCNLENMKWMLQNDFHIGEYGIITVNELAFEYAAKNGNLDIMKWMLQNKKIFSVGKRAFKCAAENGNLENMKWMLRNNFPKDELTFACAADNGNLENMKWMFLNDFPKDEWTFARAALNGNLENMKWMLQNNFPKDEYTFSNAIENGNMGNAKWMLQNNFPKDERIFTNAQNEKIKNME